MNNLDAEDDLLYTWWNREINHSLVQLKRVLCLCHRSQCNHFIKMDVFKWLNLDVCTAQSVLAYQIRQKAKHTLSCDSAWGKRVHLSSIRPLRDWTQPCPVMDSHHKVGILLTRAPGCVSVVPCLQTASDSQCIMQPMMQLKAKGNSDVCGTSDKGILQKHRSTSETSS